MTALEYFRLLAPGFSTVPDATVLSLLEVAENLVNVACLTLEPANMARAMYAAHLLYVNQQASSATGTAGVVKREKEGDLEREFDVAGAVSYGLDGNPYGARYLEFIRPCVGSAIMTRIGEEAYLWQQNVGAIWPGSMP